MWGAVDGALLAVLDHSDSAEDAWFSDNGLAVHTDRRFAWTLDEGVPYDTVNVGERLLDSTKATSETRLIATAGTGAVNLYDPATSELRTACLLDKASVVAARFSQDASRIAVSLADGQVQIRSTDTGKSIKGPLPPQESPVQRLEFNRAGNRLVTITDQGLVRLWDLDRELTEALPVPVARVSADNQWLNALRREEPLTGIAWDRTSERFATVDGQDEPEATLLSVTLDIASQPLGNAFAAHFSPDGKRLITINPRGGSMLWKLGQDEASPIPQDAEDTFTADGALFDPNGRRLVTRSDYITLQLWDAETGAHIADLDHSNFGATGSAQFSPNGSLLLVHTSGQDPSEGAAHLWDTESGRIWMRLNCPQGLDLLDVVLGPGAKHLIAWCNDNSLRVWHLPKLFAALQGDSKHLACDIDPSSKHALDELSGVTDGNLFCYDSVSVTELSDAAEIALFTPKGLGDQTRWDQPIRVFQSQTGALGGIILASAERTRAIPVLPSTQALVEHARMLLPDCLSPDERSAQALPPEPPRWCIELGKSPYEDPAWTSWLKTRDAGLEPPIPLAE